MMDGLLQLAHTTYKFADLRIVSSHACLEIAKLICIAITNLLMYSHEDAHIHRHACAHTYSTHTYSHLICWLLTDLGWTHSLFEALDCDVILLCHLGITYMKMGAVLCHHIQIGFPGRTPSILSCKPLQFILLVTEPKDEKWWIVLDPRSKAILHIDP